MMTAFFSLSRANLVYQPSRLPAYPLRVDWSKGAELSLNVATDVQVLCASDVNIAARRFDLNVRAGRVTTKTSLVRLAGTSRSSARHPGDSRVSVSDAIYRLASRRVCHVYS